MIYRYQLLERAQLEYDNSVEWYAERSTLAAENFIEAIENSIDAICRNPHRYRNNYKHFRELKLKKFPFLIIYFLDENTQQIIITSIFHEKRNPRLKYRTKK